jgi:hypothetical protein
VGLTGNPAACYHTGRSRAYLEILDDLNQGVIRMAKPAQRQPIQETPIQSALQRIEELDKERASLLKQARNETLQLRKENEIPHEQVTRALISVVRTLVGELSSKGVIDQEAFAASLQTSNPKSTDATALILKGLLSNSSPGHGSAP